MTGLESGTEHGNRNAVLSGEFRGLLEALPNPAFVCDPSGEIIAFNREIAVLWTGKPISGDPASRWYGPVELCTLMGEMPLDRNQCWIATAIHSGEPQVDEVVGPCGDGPRRIYVAQGNPLRNATGITGAVGILTDVTEIRQAELAQARLGAIVASSDDAIISKTLDGTILSWNVGAERLFGYTAEEVIGKPITVIIPFERLDEEREILAKLVRGERVEHYETVRVTKHGELRHVSLTSSPVRDTKGRIVGASKIARDVTARKRNDEHLLVLHEALRKADTAKNEFLATLAHELRNPLAPIRNLVAVLERSPEPMRELPGALQVMERQLRYMTRLIDDLMDVSRIAKNKFELRRELFDLRTAVEMAIESSQPLLSANEHHFTTEIPDEPLPMDADLTRITQAIGNVLNNAAKYTQKGGTIALRVIRFGRKVEITVTDDGVGIPPEMLDGIFGIFVQIDASVNRSYSGLGLGLHLARRLIEMQGGTLTALSEGVGKGSTFVFTLPLASTPRIAEPRL